MANQDLVGAFKSAISRKHSVAQARQTLVNAGYNSQEIKEAEQALASPKTVAKAPVKTPAKPEKPKISALTTQKKKIAILAIIISVILLGGILAFFLLR